MERWLDGWMGRDGMGVMGTAKTGQVKARQAFTYGSYVYGLIMIFFYFLNTVGYLRLLDMRGERVRDQVVENEHVFRVEVCL